MLSEKIYINKELIISLGFSLIEKRLDYYYFYRNGVKVYLYPNYAVFIEEDWYRPTPFSVDNVKEFIDYAKKHFENK